MTPPSDPRLTGWLQMYGNWLLRACVLMLDDHAAAEDAVQETFLKAWKNADKFEGRGDCSEKTWLMHIAINTCRTMRRSAWWRHVDRSKLPEELSLPAQEEDRALLMLVLDLPDKYRRLVVLHYFSGFTIDEMAQVLNMNRSTVHYRLKKALKLLKLAYTEGGDNHD